MFDTDVTALRVAAHILTVTEFSAVSIYDGSKEWGRGAQVTVLSSGL